MKQIQAHTLRVRLLNQCSEEYTINKASILKNYKMYLFRITNATPGPNQFRKEELRRNKNWKEKLSTPLMAIRDKKHSQIKEKMRLEIPEMRRFRQYLCSKRLLNRIRMKLTDLEKLIKSANKVNVIMVDSKWWLIKSSRLRTEILLAPVSWGRLTDNTKNRTLNQKFLPHRNTKTLNSP